MGLVYLAVESSVREKLYKNGLAVVRLPGEKKEKKIKTEVESKLSTELETSGQMLRLWISTWMFCSLT